MAGYTLRIAREEDAEALLSIYAPFIETPVSFETSVPTAEEFASRINDVLKMYPYLVCEMEGRIVGYAYAHRFRERSAYDWCVELSIYVDPGCARKGIGRALYGALLELLKQQGILIAYGCIALPNAGSEGLHRALGFKNLGVFERSGYKCGRWIDIVWYEKVLGEFLEEPVAPVPFLQLCAEEIAQTLEKY